MIINLFITEDHLKILKFLNFHDNGNELIVDKKVMLTIQNHILDDTAMAIGIYDKRIVGTENNENGAAYPDDIEDYLLATYNYVSDNLYYIETLLHQYASEGLKPGHYKCRDNELIWTFVE